MLTFIVWLSVAAPAPAHAIPVVPVSRSVESYEALVAEYEAAVTAWKTKLGEAGNREERKALRAQRPTESFAPRFAALAQSGEGRAILWQLDNFRYLGLSVREREPQRRRWYGQLFESHVESAWFGDALTQLWSDRKRIDEGDTLSGWLQLARDKNESAEIKAQARYYLAYDAVRSDDTTVRKRGFAALDSLVADLPDTAFADRARQDLFVMRDRVVGAMAIDFEAKTVDGEVFRLSDYRGKVVLLDFWGFW